MRWFVAKGFRVARPGAAWLLLLGVVLLLVAAGNAVHAMRDQGALATRALRNAARTSLWSYGQLLEPDYLALLEHLFHPALHVEDGVQVHPGEVRKRTPAPDEVLRAHAADSSDRHGPLSGVWQFFARDRATRWAGYAPDDVEQVSLRAAILDHARRTDIPRHAEQGFAWRGGRHGYLVVYSEQLLASDTAYYVILLDSVAVGPLLRAPQQRLRAVAALRDSAYGDPIEVAVLALGADLLSSSGTGSTLLEADLPYLEGTVLRAHVRDASAALRAGGTLPVSPLPLLLSTVVVSLGLILLGYRQMRREAKLASMRSDFVSSVSHELRTPLALQRVFIDMLKQGRVSSAQEHTWSLDNIDRENVRLTHLVNNVLQFTRIHRGTASVQLTRHSLRAAIDAAVARYRPLAAARAATIEVSDAADAIVALDVEAFPHALGNILENAIKYGPEEQCIRVSLVRQGAKVMIRVDDEGDGVPGAERGRIFDPFYRGMGQREKVVGGSGIGLSVVRELMARHDGRAWVEDAPGRGARFVLEFPVREGEA